MERARCQYTGVVCGADGPAPLRHVAYLVRIHRARLPPYDPPNVTVAALPYVSRNCMRRAVS